MGPPVSAAGGPSATRTSLVAATCTLLACPVAFYLWWIVSINTSVCGKHVDSAWKVLACAVGVLVFLALGSLGVRTYRVISIMPLALLGAALAMLLVFAVAPGSPGMPKSRARNGDMAASGQ